MVFYLQSMSLNNFDRLTYYMMGTFLAYEQFENICNIEKMKDLLYYGLNLIAFVS